jgi:hypothetical protein
MHFGQVAPQGLIEIYLKREWSERRWIVSSNMRPKVLKVPHGAARLPLTIDFAMLTGHPPPSSPLTHR